MAVRLSALCTGRALLPRNIILLLQVVISEMIRWIEESSFTSSGHREIHTLHFRLTETPGEAEKGLSHNLPWFCNWLIGPAKSWSSSGSYSSSGEFSFPWEVIQITRTTTFHSARIKYCGTFAKGTNCEVHKDLRITGFLDFVYCPVFYIQENPRLLKLYTFPSPGEGGGTYSIGSLRKS
jgi:hypothetical protein